jgi:hypothetical protein
MVLFYVALIVEAAAMSFLTTWSLKNELSVLAGTIAVVGFVYSWRSGDRPWFWFSR